MSNGSSLQLLLLHGNLLNCY